MSLFSGKNKQLVEDRYEVVGIEHLTTAGFYGEQGSGSHEHNKDFKANPINAVVVVTDPFKANNPIINTLVVLTNESVKKPLRAYDGYDARSEIENSMFRESKQAWFIQRPARNSIDGFRSHVYFTIMIMALTLTANNSFPPSAPLDASLPCSMRLCVVFHRIELSSENYVEYPAQAQSN